LLHPFAQQIQIIADATDQRLDRDKNGCQ
jgi:hypothetical protein